VYLVSADAPAAKNDVACADDIAVDDTVSYTDLLLGPVPTNLDESGSRAIYLCQFKHTTLSQLVML